MASTNSTPMAVFGPGSLYVTRNDNTAVNTPVNIGYCQEFSYDESAETKELHGQQQYALVTARGTIKATGKMKAAVVSGLAINAVFNGQSFVAGQLAMAQAVAGTVPTTPFQLTPAVPGSGTFDTDLGVVYAATGLPLVKVASGPTTGQYSCNSGTGVYTFSTGDVAAAVLMTFAYTMTTPGQKMTVINTNIGTTPSFQLDYATSLYGKNYYVRMYACISSKLTRSHKLTDFMMPEIDFSFFANAAGQVYQVSYSEVS